VALNGIPEFGFGHPAEPGHLPRIRIDLTDEDGVVDPEPVRAECAAAEELEHESDRTPSSSVSSRAVAAW
jgi:hypothetical protein